jgi:hypothetical protein
MCPTGSTLQITRRDCRPRWTISALTLNAERRFPRSHGARRHGDHPCSSDGRSDLRSPSAASRDYTGARIGISSRHTHRSRCRDGHARRLQFPGHGRRGRAAEGPPRRTGSKSCIGTIPATREDPDARERGTVSVAMRQKQPRGDEQRGAAAPDEGESSASTLGRYCSRARCETVSPSVSEKDNSRTRNPCGSAPSFLTSEVAGSPCLPRRSSRGVPPRELGAGARRGQGSHDRRLRPQRPVPPRRRPRCRGRRSRRGRKCRATTTGGFRRPITEHRSRRGCRR